VFALVRLFRFISPAIGRVSNLTTGRAGRSALLPSLSTVHLP
jgi:hypothetical protein